ncbi:MAG: hypothetical protein AAGC54_11965 [Cyanobacteria bacterium P01_F01_bin.4]
MGRKITNRSTMNRMGRAMKKAGRIGQSRLDVQQAREKAALIRDQVEALETELQQELTALETEFQSNTLEVEAVAIAATSTHITQHRYGLLWLPYHKDAQGQLSPDW